MSDEKIYLDQQGYANLLENIERLKARLHENNMGRKDAFDAGAGDGWDSPEFEEIERKERMILGELQRCYDELSRVIIIERQGNSDIVDIGDIVRVDMYFSADDFEEQLFKLVGGTPNFYLTAEIQEISINSPMGNSIYKKKVGDRCSYSVNNRQFTVLIKEKIDLSKQQDGFDKKLTK